MEKWNTVAPHEGDTIKYWRSREGKYDTSGENSRTSKLTKDQVYKIKFERPNSSRDQIAQEFGISKNYVSQIRTGRKWGHVKQ